MARPTGIQSRARRIPIDIDDAVQAEADRRKIGWADELRRMYLAVKAEPVSSGTSGFPTSDEGTERPLAPEPRTPGGRAAKATGANPRPPVGQIEVEETHGTDRGDTVRCRCAKPTLSAASGMRVCTTCHLPRRQ